METNCTQISIMTRRNERLQCDIFLAPVNISAPGYHAYSPCISLSVLFSFNRASTFNFFPFSHHVSYSQRGSSDSHSSEELPIQGGYTGRHPGSSGSEESIQELFEVGVHPQLNPPSSERPSPAHCTGTVARMMVAQHLRHCV